MNVIVRLLIELAYYDIAVQYVSHYTTGTHLVILGKSKILYYFGNARHNSAALDAFTNIVKVANHTVL